MGVKGDELPAWWRGAGGDTSPYDRTTPWDAKSAPLEFQWTRPATVNEDGVKGAFEELGRIIGVCTRFCPACYNDLGDIGSPRSSTPTGHEASTGQKKNTEPPSQGGHEPNCPVAYLLVWLHGKESVYTRIRPESIPITGSHVVAPQMGVERSEAVGGSPDSSEAERAAHAAAPGCPEGGR